MTIIDARGLSCPEPVVLLRSAMASQEPVYQIIVDNHASRENTTRYAQHQGQLGEFYFRFHAQLSVSV